MDNPGLDSFSGPRIPLPRSKVPQTTPNRAVETELSITTTLEPAPAIHGLQVDRQTSEVPWQANWVSIHVQNGKVKAGDFRGCILSSGRYSAATRPHHMDCSNCRPSLPPLRAQPEILRSCTLRTVRHHPPRPTTDIPRPLIPLVHSA